MTAHPGAAETIDELALLDGREAAAWRDRVLSLRDAWTRRHPELPFFTLGAAAYLDAQGDSAGYACRAREGNGLLTRHFEPLYERLAASLAERLAEPVYYDGRRARPGFHVYLAHPVFEHPIASVHCDTQYRLIDWGDEMARDFTRTLSFTLALRLPGAGGGLNCWPVSHEEVLAHAPGPLATLLDGRAPRFVAYSEGTLVLHSGHVLHQAAASRPLAAHDERITLQGHAIRGERGWELYW